MIPKIRGGRGIGGYPQILLPVREVGDEKDNEKNDAEKNDDKNEVRKI